MKKLLFVFLAVALILAITYIARPVQAADAQTNLNPGECPEYLDYPGSCLTEEPGLVQVETDVPEYTGPFMRIDTEWKPDRWLIQIAVTAPTPPVLPGGFNFNRYRLELDSLFVDQRQLADPPENDGQLFNAVIVYVKLVCDWEGSTEPTLNISMPRQEVMLANGVMYHRVPSSERLIFTNGEIVNQPCSYP